MSLALHETVEDGHLDIIEVLLSAGADISTLDAQNLTALDIAMEPGLADAVLAELVLEDWHDR